MSLMPDLEAFNRAVKQTNTQKGALGTTYIPACTNVRGQNMHSNCSFAIGLGICPLGWDQNTIPTSLDIPMKRCPSGGGKRRGQWQGICLHKHCHSSLFCLSKKILQKHNFVVRCWITSSFVFLQNIQQSQFHQDTGKHHLIFFLFF